MPNFIKDLSDGHSFEDEICTFVQIKYPKAHRIKGYFKGYDIYVPERDHKIECKFDRKSQQTPNIAVEFFDRGKPSGITTTTATHWIYKFYDEEWKLAIGRVDVFRDICKGKREVRGGDGWQAKMYLVPKAELLKKEGIKIRKPIDK